MIGSHRVRRLHWRSAAPTPAQAFALRTLLHEQADAVHGAIDRVLSEAAPDGTWLRVPTLALQIDAHDLDDLGEHLVPRLEAAMREALRTAVAAADPSGRPPPAAGPPGGAGPSAARTAGQEPSAVQRIPNAAAARTAWLEYLATGRLGWVLAGVPDEVAWRVLRDAAATATDESLAGSLALDGLLPDAPRARLGALVRWLALLPAAARRRWLAASPAPAIASPEVVAEWRRWIDADEPGGIDAQALWLACPRAALPSGADAIAPWLAWVDERRAGCAPAGAAHALWSVVRAALAADDAAPSRAEAAPSDGQTSPARAQMETRAPGAAMAPGVPRAAESADRIGELRTEPPRDALRDDATRGAAIVRGAAPAPAADGSPGREPSVAPGAPAAPSAAASPPSRRAGGRTGVEPAGRSQRTGVEPRVPGTTGHDEAGPVRGPTAASPFTGPAADTATLVPMAGLVLLHPYLPRLLGGLGLLDDDGRHVIDRQLPRACALLHALAHGDAEAAEFELPFAKLLLGRQPDDALDAALPALADGERAEVDALLDAVRGHWTALRGTGRDGLRVSFLQRRGLLRHGDGAWRLHLVGEPFDMLIALLPWSISLVRLPWMREPLVVEWPTP